MIGSETPSIWSFQRAIGENGKNSLVHSFEQPGALVSHSLKDSQKSASKLRQMSVNLRTNLIFHRPMHFLRLKKETLVFENLFTPHFINWGAW